MASHLETVGQLLMVQVRCRTVHLCFCVDACLLFGMQKPLGISEDMVVVKLVRG